MNTRQLKTFLLSWLGLIIGGGLILFGQTRSAPIVEFDRDIRPILSDRCYACHGADEANRQANLRLDTKEGVFAEEEGDHYILPGSPRNSKIFNRITSKELSLRMPPVYSGLKLSKEEIELIRLWIEQGAKWQLHWSFIPPKSPKFPEVTNKSWPRNGIDFFVLDRLTSKGMIPSPEATKTTLIRRVSLDLTGLPPTPEEVEAFLTDKSEGAYERVVDRLLRSPRYGERMTQQWLDAARYADSNGYQTDGERIMWRWRDWVIDAFNANMPFDQFTIEQLAGDMLPQPTLEQRIATGFNRNHRGNGEGGIIPEEFAVEYVVDRVETTATVWQGLTLGCARCHDHKYDPFTQKEFYEAFAFFNNIPERGKVWKYGNSPPMIKAPTKKQQQQLADFDHQIELSHQKFSKLTSKLVKTQQKWEASFKKRRPLHWSISEDLLAHFPLDGNTRGVQYSMPGSRKRNLKKGKFESGRRSFTVGRIGKAGNFDGERFINAGNVGKFGFYDRFSLGAWVYPAEKKGGAIFSRTVELAKEEGYQIVFSEGKLQVNLVKRWLDDAIRVETEKEFSPNQWYHVMVTYDGSRTSRAIKIYVNGKSMKFKVFVDDLNLTFDEVKEPFRIGSGGGLGSRFKGLIDDVRIYGRTLSAEEVQIVATAASINDIVAKSVKQRSPSETDKLRAYFLERHAPKAIKAVHQEIITFKKRRATFMEEVPTTMVMQEREQPKPTFMLLRGVYNRPGEKVDPGIPLVLKGTNGSNLKTRLDLAKWLVNPENPLTARVVINRYWQMYFGQGLVQTIEDFGSQGERPSHPRLLDWLATEFVRNEWDIKAMQKIIVMSATYRQSSRATAKSLQEDPRNLLLARGPRVRLSAQAIRDQALFVGGLLVEKLGGPSVKPYQPEGLWEELAGDIPYNQSKGDDLYRRSLYTFWKRTIAPPSMLNFDAAQREMCTVRESRTNTPLQALNLMNDVTFVESARGLAQRLLTNKKLITPEDRLIYAFRIALARSPKATERKILIDSLNVNLDFYQSNFQLAEKLVSVGDSLIPKGLDLKELAAYTTVASLVLNLDETITKE